MKRVVCICALMAIVMSALVSCGQGTGDFYIRSLKIESEILSATDSIDLDSYENFSPRDVMVADSNWYVISSDKGNYNLLFLNRKSGESFLTIRKGRGPGEIISGYSLHKCENKIRYYDFASSKCIELNLEKSVSVHGVVCDTVADFCAGERPVYMTSCGKDRFISGRISDKESWYALYDRCGRILSSVKSIDYESMNSNAAVSAMLSSKYTTDYDGAHLCVVNCASPTISFSSICDDQIMEYKRIQLKLMAGVSSHMRDAKSFFNGVCADNEHVYILYSGKKLSDRTSPAYECSHLVVYDWNGNIKHHYVLNRPVRSICLFGDCLYAVSGYPSGKLFRFYLK